MPYYSEISKKRLCECCEDLQKLFSFVILYLDCSVLVGYRGEIEQNKAVESKKSSLKFPYSKHNVKPSLAVDVAPYPIDFNNKKRFYYFAGSVMAVAKILKESGEITHDIRWGGDWDRDNDLDDQNLYDLLHFEVI